jgi:hypothetical protein
LRQNATRDWTRRPAARSLCRNRSELPARLLRPPRAVLARTIHEARREGGKSAAVSGPSDRSRPQAYVLYVEDRRREKALKMQCY